MCVFKLELKLNKTEEKKQQRTKIKSAVQIERTCSEGECQWDCANFTFKYDESLAFNGRVKKKELQFRSLHVHRSFAGRPRSLVKFKLKKYVFWLTISYSRWATYSYHLQLLLLLLVLLLRSIHEFIFPHWHYNRLPLISLRTPISSMSMCTPQLSWLVSSFSCSVYSFASWPQTDL